MIHVRSGLLRLLGKQFLTCKLEVMSTFLLKYLQLLALASMKVGTSVALAKVRTADLTAMTPIAANGEGIGYSTQSSEVSPIFALAKKMQVYRAVFGIA